MPFPATLQEPLCQTCYDVAAATAALTILPQLDASGRSFLAGICHSEPRVGTSPLMTC